MQELSTKYYLQRFRSEATWRARDALNRALDKKAEELADSLVYQIECTADWREVNIKGCVSSSIIDICTRVSDANRILRQIEEACQLAEEAVTA